MQGASYVAPCFGYAFEKSYIQSSTPEKPSASTAFTTSSLFGLP